VPTPLPTTPPAPSWSDRFRGPWRILLKEITAFGAVGALCLILDLGLFNLLLHQDIGVLTAKCISTGVATTVAYLGNRHLSFSHRARTGLARETSYFFAINIVALIGAELALALFAYPLGFKYDHLIMNLVNLATIALGTIFRFWSYKRFVFLHPDRVAANSARQAEEVAG
jgi:putative flippase GtrA